MIWLSFDGFSGKALVDQLDLIIIEQDRQAHRTGASVDYEAIGRRLAARRFRRVWYSDDTMDPNARWSWMLRYSAWQRDSESRDSAGPPTTVLPGAHGSSMGVGLGGGLGGWGGIDKGHHHEHRQVGGRRNDHASEAHDQGTPLIFRNELKQPSSTLALSRTRPSLSPPSRPPSSLPPTVDVGFGMPLACIEYKRRFDYTDAELMCRCHDAHTTMNTCRTVNE